MQLNLIATTSGPDGYYDPSFLTTLEAHLTYLRSLPTNRVLTVKDQSAFKYEGDFYGLLDSLSIPKQYHYALMIINGLNSSNSYTASKLLLIIPDYNEIDLIKAIHNTRAVIL